MVLCYTEENTNLSVILDFNPGYTVSLSCACPKLGARTRVNYLSGTPWVEIVVHFSTEAQCKKANSRGLSISMICCENEKW